MGAIEVVTLIDLHTHTVDPADYRVFETPSGPRLVITGKDLSFETRITRALAHKLDGRAPLILTIQGQVHPAA